MAIAGLTVFLGFNAGGFFPGATAIAALVVCLLAVLGIMLVSRPFESFTPGLLVPLALLAGFAVWTLVSAAWSHAPGRALLEFDRALLYVLVFAFFGMLAPGKRRLEWGLRGIRHGRDRDLHRRLDHQGRRRRLADLPRCSTRAPQLSAHLLERARADGHAWRSSPASTSPRGSGSPVSRRVLGAAAIPLLASTLLLTFSRSSLALAVVGILLYAAIARPRRLLTTLVAVVPSAGGRPASPPTGRS